VRLKTSWQAQPASESDNLVERLVGRERAEQLDQFDKIQLAGVLKLCLEAHTLSDAGRRLFMASRGRKKTANDADRLRKYLARFGLDWRQVREML
jgi:transcriptional regulatory protein RtcR